MSNTAARRTTPDLRSEDARARKIERRIQESQALAPLASEKPELVDARTRGPRRKRRALLIVNSKSGPDRDSLLRTRELVDILAGFRIRADVRVKLRKSLARKEARAAARDGRYDFVIAAGGDGTVEAVASGLVGSRVTLGIIPLGTFNNVATSLGIPADVRQACALIACGAPRQIDAGLTIARYMKRPRLFLEVSTVGVGALVGSLGQNVEKGRWAEAAVALPAAAGLSLTPTRVRLDCRTDHITSTLLVTVSNTPRAGAGLKLAPDARMDDALLDVHVYQDLDQASLARALPSLLLGSPVMDVDEVWRARAHTVDIHTARPLPVAIESKLVGVTPARFTVLPGALWVVVGDTDALLHPPSPALVRASQHAAAALALPEAVGGDHASPLPADTSPGARAVQALLPVAGNTLEALSAARSMALPLTAGAVGVVVGAMLRTSRRESNRGRRLRALLSSVQRGR